VLGDNSIFCSSSSASEITNVSLFFILSSHHFFLAGIGSAAEDEFLEGRALSKSTRMAQRKHYASDI